MSTPTLIWHGDHGTLSSFPGLGAYDDAYFDKYVGYANTQLGRLLNKARVDLVVDNTNPVLDVVCDIGVGCGQFVLSQVNFVGYDINPKAVEWLKEQRLFLDPYKSCVPVLTFWDSFEHIENPAVLLERCTRKVFMSIPIFKDKDHVLRSKHFRPDEHHWYFSELGLLNYMSRAGFEMVCMSDIESHLGREDILTFVFKRL